MSGRALVSRGQGTSAQASHAGDGSDARIQIPWKGGNGPSTEVPAGVLFSAVGAARKGSGMLSVPAIDQTAGGTILLQGFSMSGEFGFFVAIPEGDLRRLPGDWSYATDPAWSPDRSTIAFSRPCTRLRHAWITLAGH